jgi:hypothetical protein
MHCNQQPETGRKPLALIAASHWALIPIVLMHEAMQAWERELGPRGI